MVDSPSLKIGRASKHVADLNKLLRECPPFTYISKTNPKTGQRSIGPKKNEAVINECALLIGDAAHNMRSAIDHAYWDVVSPFATSEREERMVQFPFCETASGLGEAAKKRLADRVPGDFFNRILALKPYSEDGGNNDLHLINHLNIIDKHKLLAPTGNYTAVSAKTIRKQLPDFPRFIELENMSVVGDSRSDAGHIAWHIPPIPFWEGLDTLEQEIDIPVDIILYVGKRLTPRPVIPSLNALLDVARETVRIIRAS